MGKRKKGAYRYGKAVSFDFRIKHPVVNKPPKGGVAEAVPITHKEKEPGHRHYRLPKHLKITGRWRRDGSDSRPSYAVGRVLHESESNLSKPLLARIAKADNKVINRIFKKHKGRKKG